MAAAKAVCPDAACSSSPAASFATGGLVTSHRSPPLRALAAARSSPLRVASGGERRTARPPCVRAHPCVGLAFLRGARARAWLRAAPAGGAPRLQQPSTRGATRCKTARCCMPHCARHQHATVQAAKLRAAARLSLRARRACVLRRAQERVRRTGAPLPCILASTTVTPVHTASQAASACARSAARGTSAQHPLSRSGACATRFVARRRRASGAPGQPVPRGRSAARPPRHGRGAAGGAARRHGRPRVPPRR